MKNKFNLFCSLFTFAAIFIYLWEWRFMPLYPDEVAYAMMRSRFLYDKGFIYSFFATCDGNFNIVPYFFYPAAWFLSKLGALSHWTLNRAIPISSLMLLASAVLYYGRKYAAINSAYTPLFLMAAFVGVAGSGFVLLRPEVYLAITGAVLVMVLTYCSSDNPSTFKTIFLWLSLCFASEVLLYVHLQGFVLLPPVCILLYRLASLAKKFYSVLLTLLTTIYIPLAAWFAYHLNATLSCSNAPRISTFISSLTLSGVLKTEGMTVPFFQKIADNFEHFDRMQFMPSYQVNYLPSFDYATVGLKNFIETLNQCIGYFSSFILFSFILMCLYLSLAGLIRTINIIFRAPKKVRALHHLLLSDFMLLYSACLGILALFLYDMELNFYRAFYLNLSMTILLLFGVSGLRGRVFKIVVICVGLFASCLSVTSTVIARQYIKGELANGYAGPSIPLNIEWDKVDQTVKTLKASCHIPETATNIIIDDKTYDAMKHHQRIYPVTYLALIGVVDKMPIQIVINAVNANYAVMRCGDFEGYQIKYDARIDDLCCATFHKQKT